MIAEKLSLARAAEDRDDFDMAAALYRECLLIDPDHPESLRELAILTYGIFKDTKQARQLLERSLQSEDSPTGHFYLALVLDRLDEFARAKVEFETAIQASGGDAMMQSMYADVLAGRGELELAAQYFRGALEAEPDYAPAMEGLEKVEAILKPDIEP